MEWSQAAALAAYESQLLVSRSSLDLLDDEAGDSDIVDLPEQSHSLSVEGTPASTVKRAASKISSRKPAGRKLLAKRGSGCISRSGTVSNSSSSNNNNEATEEYEQEARRQWMVERTRLLEELERAKLELTHSRAEKLELEKSFQRLDREIGDGYNLSARKEKEMRISELQAKNQKLAEMLEKELTKLNELRFANEELTRERDGFKSRVELLSGLLRSSETKLSDLSDSHAALTTNYSAAQKRMEALQDRVNELQDQLVSSTACEAQFSEYEEKLRRWERKCRALENSLNEAMDRSRDLQRCIENTNGETQQALHDRDKLETELQDAQDKLIQMTATLRAVEAKLESDMRQSDPSNKVDLLHQRIRTLESDLSERTTAYLEVKQAFNQLLTVPNAQGDYNASKRLRDRGVVRGQASMDAFKTKSRQKELEEKLRRAEHARDRKGCTVSVLLQALPFLMCQIDDLSSKYQAATESNEILKSAIEQMQTSWVGANDGQLQTKEDTTLSPLAYLHLARENFILGAPLTATLIAECSGVSTLFDFAFEGGHGGARHKASRPSSPHFIPFRVALRPSRSSNSQADVPDADTPRLLVIAAEEDDSNGESYLNRSKINLFLQFVQGHAAKSKTKALLVSKLAECLTKMRELSWRFASERSSHQATIQLLTREVSDLKHRLQLQQQPLHSKCPDNEGDETVSTSRRQLLLKLIDLYAEKQQEQRQSTFLTQAETSDVLINRDLTLHQKQQQQPADDADVLTLRNLKLCDRDIEQLLWKILVSEARFVELQLDGNALSDAGATSVANFVSKLPESMQTLSLRGNSSVSELGIEKIRNGIMRNPRVHRVESDHSSNSLVALAAMDDFELSGKPMVIFRILLPERASANTSKAIDQEEASALLDSLRQRGFRQEDILSPQRQRRESSRRAVAPASSIRRTNLESSRAATATSIRSSTERRARVFKTRQQAKLQALEDALRNASSPSSHSQRIPSRGSAPLLATKRSLSATPYAQTLGRRIGFSNGALKLVAGAAGRAHVSTVRGLRR